MSEGAQVIAFPGAGDEEWSAEGQPWIRESRRDAPGLDSLFVWAYRMRASRVWFQSGERAGIRLHGRNRFVTKEIVDEGQMAQIANHLYGADGTARLQNGSDFDVSYEVPLGRRDRLRFRINATPTRTSRGVAANIVVRPIPDLPPSLDEQLVEQGIRDAFSPRDGMVIVSGATGSGKSTLIAGMTVATLLDADAHSHIVEAAAPIEFLLDRVRSPSSTINQTEIGRDLKDFPSFIRGCMRREPTHIIVGECRDGETMAAAVQAAISGHVLITTIHANDVPLTMQRIASLCPPAERANLISAVAQSLRLVINQRLVPSTDGRRTALREYLAFDAPLRARFLETDPDDWPALTRRAVEEQGQSYRAAIARALEQSRISETVASRELREVA